MRRNWLCFVFLYFALIRVRRTSRVPSAPAKHERGGWRRESGGKVLPRREKRSWERGDSAGRRDAAMDVGISLTTDRVWGLENLGVGQCPA